VLGLYLAGLSIGYSVFRVVSKRIVERLLQSGDPLEWSEPPPGSLVGLGAEVCERFFCRAEATPHRLIGRKPRQVVACEVEAAP
jgi:hypothetical protein